MMIDRISLLLVIIGALNWGSVGGIWCISLLFREPSARQIQDH